MMQTSKSIAAEMTALATISRMLLALALGTVGTNAAPLAIAVIGGIVVLSMGLSLIITPAISLLPEQGRARGHGSEAEA